MSAGHVKLGCMRGHTIDDPSLRALGQMRPVHTPANLSGMLVVLYIVWPCNVGYVADGRHQGSPHVLSSLQCRCDRLEHLRSVSKAK